MLYTDTEQWSDERTCLFPDASGRGATSWCGYKAKTDSLTAVSTLASTLEDYLRQEDHICTTCVNEMARSMNVSATTRVRWVEDYAGGTLAEHLHEDAEDEGYDRLTVLR